MQKGSEEGAKQPEGQRGEGAPGRARNKGRKEEARGTMRAPSVLGQGIRTKGRQARTLRMELRGLEGLEIPGLLELHSTGSGRNAP